MLTLDETEIEIEETIGLDCSEIVHASAKVGLGIEDILEEYYVCQVLFITR